MSGYILSIDQSTSGTKALLLDEKGNVAGRADRAHEQKISAEGWVSHDAAKIYDNLLEAVREVLQTTGCDPATVCAAAITNQRETALIWDAETGLPLMDAVVWQCARASDVCSELTLHAQEIQRSTGLPLSPYYSAAKIAWLLRRACIQPEEKICAGTMDSYLLYRLTGGACFYTDVSNASRTQLMNLETLDWDEEICAWFGIPKDVLPRICDSNACFGRSDFGGALPKAVPIHAMMGDSHAALYGQGCHQSGEGKVTYGTGSSIMINIGSELRAPVQGLVTSLAWRMNGTAQYVWEGNIHYAGAALEWLRKDLGLLASAGEAENLARQAHPQDTTYLVPAFTGLGAPYWKTEAKALLCGMTRHTGKAEIVRAALDSIAYQVNDVLQAMGEGLAIRRLCADGGPTRNAYLMQFQSDLTRLPVAVAQQEELSAIGAGLAAGLAVGLYTPEVFENRACTLYRPQMPEEVREEKIQGWRHALSLT